jgi:hypothetical protein
MSGKELSQLSAFENALDSGLLVVEFLEMSPLAPFVEHIQITMKSIDKSRSVSNAKKVREKTIEVFRALTNASKNLDNHYSLLAIRGTERMLRDLERHNPAKGRQKAINKFYEILESYTPRNKRI